MSDLTPGDGTLVPFTHATMHADGRLEWHYDPRTGRPVPPGWQPGDPVPPAPGNADVVGLELAGWRPPRESDRTSPYGGHLRDRPIGRYPLARSWEARDADVDVSHYRNRDPLPRGDYHPHDEHGRPIPDVELEPATLRPVVLAVVSFAAGVIAAIGVAVGWRP